ncbi:hypothetical protein [Deinococcus sp. QL22]|uniref:hypothetical protein n=1 Tax=Deinococcus sp. QL22 TaxID=2939437 RepID=UPI0020182A24|nr:hypothetical protein [Deinococcus sp. QL22]UQN06553.1 hypothetical protein M1R55_01130 [Deinococcus sp. QL22]
MTAAEALQRLKTGEGLVGVEVRGQLDLQALEDTGGVRLPVLLRGCRLPAVDASDLVFHAPVTFERCHVDAALFYAAYFLQGARFEACTFGGDVTFECGGHNEAPAAFTLLNCTFQGFVNFFDNWYPGPVEVRGCRFEGGTNLLGNRGQPYEVAFDLPPQIEGNSGVLDADGG